MPLTETKTTQRDNVVGRDQAGRDIINNYSYDASQPTRMGRLIEGFRTERESDKQFHETLDVLKHFACRRPGEEVIGLEAKLEESGRQDLLDFARATKEMFAKRLVEFEFSEAAQEMHAYLLAEVWTRFHNHVVPEIKSGKPLAEVNAALQRSVLDPVESMLEDNVLRLYSNEINGMLYFLTGNCHIRWV